jgi:WXG100 family type VII secretion target
VNSYRVDTGVMATAAGRIGEAAERIDELLSKMVTDVDNMLAAWSGPAANAHKSMHERFVGDANTINTSLREMQDALLRTHRAYTTQETEQTDDHRRFQASISE